MKGKPASKWLIIDNDKLEAAEKINDFLPEEYLYKPLSREMEQLPVSTCAKCFPLVMDGVTNFVLNSFCLSFFMSEVSGATYLSFTTCVITIKNYSN